MINPTEKTLKPSDTVFAGIPSGGPWSMTDIRDAIRRIAAYLDEQHAAEQADRAGLPRPPVAGPRFTERPFLGQGNIPMTNPTEKHHVSDPPAPQEPGSGERS